MDSQSYTKANIFYIKRMMWLYHRKASAVISVSDRAKDDLALYAGANPDKFSTVYNAPDAEFFEQPDQ